MDYFTGHKLIKTQNGYTVVLYINQQMAEFAKEFLEGENPSDIGKKYNKTITQYIKNNLPAIKAGTVTISIMLGTILITSFNFNTNAVPTDADGTHIIVETPNDSNILQPGEDIKDINIKDNGQNNKNIIETENDINDNSTNENKQNNKNIIETEKDMDDSNTNKKEVENSKIYTVKSGDTLYSISNRFNVSIGTLRDKNNLSDTTIYVGQKLIISDKDESAIDDNTSNVLNPSDILVLVNKNNSLTSDYIPTDLIVPDVAFSFNGYHEKKLMRQNAASALEDLFGRAKKENINLYAVSGYRSYARQKTIFNSNVKKYGFQKANQFSAQPGQSEHQTGLSIDVSSASVNMALRQSFGQTKEGKWLAENAHKSGFIIRYPKGKEHITGYQYEPWHIRYVGIDNAKEIVTQNITLEEYLEKFT